MLVHLHLVRFLEQSSLRQVIIKCCQNFHSSLKGQKHLHCLPPIFREWLIHHTNMCIWFTHNLQSDAL